MSWPADGEPRLEEVAEGCFAYVQPDGSWWINNTGLVTGSADAGALAVDTCATERRTRAFVEAVSGVAPGGIGVLANTHHHGDHTNGNGIVAGATIIGHRRCREEMLRNGILRPEGVFEPVEWGELTLAPPVVTFEERLDLHLGDRRLELHHVGIAAHTTNDVVVWVPEERVLFTGDLAFNGGTPFVLMGSIAGTLLALDRLVEFDAEVIVPGHGPPSGPEVLDTVGAYVRLVQEHAETAYKAGLSPLEAARQLELGSFAELTDSERLVGNMHRAFAECAGARPGADIDLAAAFADMIAFNGGRPLRCRA